MSIWLITSEIVHCAIAVPAGLTNADISDKLTKSEAFMQNAVYGMYNDGQVVFDEPVPIRESRVKVVFLNKKPLEICAIDNFFETYGVWEDSRTPDKIINDIYSSRINRDVKV